MASLDDAIDRLYGLPLGDFTQARNALAATLAKSGDKAAATSVKALEKPTLSAWAVNQISRRAAPALEAMIAKGDRARAAQAKALAGGKAGELRERVGELRDALLDLRGRAAKLLTEAGHAASEDTLERITTTLRTASQASEAAELVREGRLADDLDPLGLAVLSAGPRAAVTAAPRERRTAARESETTPPRESLRERTQRIAAESRGGPTAVPDHPKRAAAVEAGNAAQERRQREAERAREVASARAEAQRRREEAERHREEARAEKEERRRQEAKLAKMRELVQRAEAEDTKAKAAVKAADVALDAAQRALDKAKDAREDTLAAARRARQEMEKAGG